MYRCNECCEEFEKPRVKKTTRPDADGFSETLYETVCPRCGCYSFEEIEEEEEEAWKS